MLNFPAVQSYEGVFILSTLSTTSLEEVGKAAPDCIRWFQLYIYKDRYRYRPFNCGGIVAILTDIMNFAGKLLRNLSGEQKRPVLLVLF